MEECSSIIFDSNNETFKMLLEKLVEIVREYNDIFEEIADLDFLDYIMKMDINEYLIGTNGDNFELRLTRCATLIEAVKNLVSMDKNFS